MKRKRVCRCRALTVFGHAWPDLVDLFLMRQFSLLKRKSHHRVEYNQKGNYSRDLEHYSEIRWLQGAFGRDPYRKNRRLRPVTRHLISTLLTLFLAITRLSPLRRLSLYI